MKKLKKSKKSKRSKGKQKPKKPTPPSEAKLHYNKEGVNQYGGVKKGGGCL